MQAVSQEYSLNPLSTKGPNQLDLLQTEHLKKVRMAGVVHGQCGQPPQTGREDHASFACLLHGWDWSEAACDNFLQDEKLYETTDEAEMREHVLGRLDDIVKAWVRSVLQAEGYSSSMVEEVNAKIFTFGSYRLGVHGPGAERLNAA
eukprot:308466-Chlamydomonas_euryale.AAC.12